MTTPGPRRSAVGRVIGGYTLVELLGKGASGTVYEARPSEPGPPVAIKLFHEREGDDGDAAARREFASSAELRHRNIIRSISAGQESGTVYLVMELLEGESLRDRLRRTPGPMDPIAALDIAAQLALGLHHAHEHGIVHRDIKPANIWVTSDGEVKVLDFGVAKARESTITADGSLVGTIAYMSPEQVAGRGEPDARSDVFAAGAVLYEMLAGRRPFDADSVPAQLARILNDAPPPLPPSAAALPGLQALVDRALSKPPEQRFGDAQDFALAAWDLMLRAQQPADAAPTGGQGRGASSADSVVMRPESAEAAPAAPRTSRPPLAAVAAVLLLAAAGGGYVLFGRRTAESPSAAAGTAGAPGAEASSPAGAASSGPAATRRADAPATAEASATTADAAGDVVVSSEPAEAAVAVDGKADPTRTPVTLTLRPGQTVRLSKAGFAPVDVIVTPAMLAAGTLTATLPAAAPARLHAVGEYPFEVVVGSRVVSPAALEHTVTVTAGLPARLRNTEFLLDMPVRFDAKRRDLDVRVPPAGRLSLRTTFETCAVFLDGRDFGYPPLAGLTVASGKHSAELRCPDGRTLRSSFTINAGQPHVEVIR